MRKGILIGIPLAIILLYFAWSLSLLTENASNERANIIDAIPEGTAENIRVSILPSEILQGDPVLVTINGTSSVKSLSLNGKELKAFNHRGKSSVTIGIDLRAKTGTSTIAVLLNDGRKVEEKFVVREREIVKVTFSIPKKLGGDSKESEKRLVSTLVKEGAIINSLPTSGSKLWRDEFIFPVADPFVTDVYGKSRRTGGTTLSHKGTDFRAPTGTEIYAMNSGEVVFSRPLRNYGNTIVIDHGLGLQTIYMHLSRFDVKEGDVVEKRQTIGRSGDTGYTFGAHLHLSIRINGISIDPMKFMSILGIGL